MAALDEVEGMIDIHLEKASTTIVFPGMIQCGQYVARPMAIPVGEEELGLRNFDSPRIDDIFKHNLPNHGLFWPPNHASSKALHPRDSRVTQMQLRHHLCSALFWNHNSRSPKNTAIRNTEFIFESEIGFKLLVT